MVGEVVGEEVEVRVMAGVVVEEVAQGAEGVMEQIPIKLVVLGVTQLCKQTMTIQLHNVIL